MSTGGRPPAGDDPDVPFAFPDDGAGDAAPPSGAGGPAGRPPRGTGDPGDPFAFPDDGAAPAGDPEADGPAPAGPPARTRRGRRGTRRPAGQGAPEDEQAARMRNVADDASAHARAVGARWLVGAVVVFLVLVVITTVSGGPDGDGGDVQPGERLPEFAAPLVDQPKLSAEDVNLATKDGQGEAGEKAACSIRNRSVVTSCALLARGPLVVVVFSRGVGSCVEAVDAVDAERRRFPGLQALAVSLLGRHDTTGETARDRRWTLPVVYDRDGALGSVLGVPACPLVLFVRPDGTVDRRIIGSLDRAELVAAMRRLVAPAPGATTVDSAPPGR
jgi:hypothetical protein